MWAAFALANCGAMLLWPILQTVPFHVVWISLILLYGYRIWRIRTTLLVLAGVMVATGVTLALGTIRGVLLLNEMLAVPWAAAMFLAMAWHARRHVEARRALEQRADEHRSLLARQERFIHDASHELRTPVTIARGHLELLRRRLGPSAEIDVALDELSRIDAMTGRLLLLATADQPDFVQPFEIELEPLLEEVFMRWSEAAPRSWRLGPLTPGSLRVDAARLRVALDALIENAVKYSPPTGAIELSARREGETGVAIAVRDEGRGVPASSLQRIFERFARADPGRSRDAGGVGLGLAIVDAIVKAHGGSATVTSTTMGSVFTLHLPGFTPIAVRRRVLAASANDGGPRASRGAAEHLRAEGDFGWDAVPASPL